MKRHLFFLVFLLLPFCARAVNAPLSAEGELDFNSRYVRRGIALSEGAVLNPSVSVSGCGTTLSAWGNVVSRDEANHGKFDEVDVTLGYERKWGKLKMAPSIASYFYPNRDDIRDSSDRGSKKKPLLFVLTCITM